MLLPALSKAREKARQAKCMANLKQLGLAYFLYSQDYDGRLCVPYMSNSYWPEGTSQGVPWPVLMRDYLGDKKIKSPTDAWQGLSRGGKTILDCPTNRNPMLYVLGPDYAMNLYPFHRTVLTLRVGPTWRQEGQVRNGSRVALFADSTIQSSYYSYEFGRTASYWGNWHNDGNNLLFFDGHVEWWSRADIAAASDAYKPPWWSQ